MGLMTEQLKQASTEKDNVWLVDNVAMSFVFVTGGFQYLSQPISVENANFATIDVTVSHFAIGSLYNGHHAPTTSLIKDLNNDVLDLA